MHTNHSIEVPLHADEAVYLQIADHIRRQVALGELGPGSRLPTIRALAETMRIDPGTVARAYRELEREGVIAGRPGRGSFVSMGVGGSPLSDQQRKRLALVVERAILEAIGLGFTAEEIETSFALSLAGWRERRVQAARARRAGSAQRSREVRFVGSHDLAAELLLSHLATLHPDPRFSATFVGSLAGLVALASREADLAGSHLLDSESGEFNVPFVARLMPQEDVVLMNLMQRFQGLMAAHGNPRRITGIADLARADVTFVNRQRGSGTRVLLDSRLLEAGIAAGQVTGYDHEEKTHTAVASLIAQGRVDVGLGAESAAAVLGLHFVPLFKERYDLVALAATFERPALRRLREVVAGKTFQNMLRSVPGYDVSDTGKVTIVGPHSRGAGTERPGHAESRG